MEVKIGVQDAAREVSLVSQDTQEAVIEAVATAVADGSLLTLVDDRGRTVIVPGTRIAYVEIGAPSTRRVGFGS